MRASTRDYPVISASPQKARYPVMGTRGTSHGSHAPEACGIRNPPSPLHCPIPTGMVPSTVSTDLPRGLMVKNRLPMKETQVQSLIREEHTCKRGTKSMSHNY